MSWLQQELKSERLHLIPLEDTDFHSLYQIANDPLLWEQHPNKNRYQLDEFRNYFNGAMESKGAYKILQKQSNQIMGCTRFYDFDSTDNSILIGYTFLGRPFWNQGYNQELKKLMVQHAFRFADIVRFHIGITNFRSQKSIETFGAKKVGEHDIAYFGEPAKTNFIYEVKNPIQRF
ncbi:GNAT family N-acetyltransferase [Flavihumibacter sp. UBA7668]|uniref:GNAT family N-acetyltransferase n=1 Tax=Flavihumibacter sp. UBA7668 TaxID=1946542 RepID=UPI0025C207E3|nr:GNAT family N-acetyltransferase [Flavihumibacter sp. UBA7668]